VTLLGRPPERDVALKHEDRQRVVTLGNDGLVRREAADLRQTDENAARFGAAAWKRRLENL
jgi:hypothetical protein